MNALVQLCSFPERLHPASAFFLRQYIDGDISAAIFLQYFSLPNSTYIALGRCIVETSVL